MVDTRADLQGFRGFAVILLFLFGVFPHSFKNGSVGVDIFFVLSGYLTQMHYGDKATTLNGIYAFLRNKMLRLFPAYFAVLFGIVATGCVLLPSKHAEDLINDSKWAIFLSTNLMGYFTNRGFFMQDHSFLHHTWIVSVQLQYILLTPFIFIHLSKCRTEEAKLANCYLFAFFSLLFHLFTIGPLSSQYIFTRLWQFQLGAISFLTTPSRELLEEEKKYDLWSHQQSEEIGKKWREEVRTAYVLLSAILASITIVPDSCVLIESDTLIKLMTTVLVSILFAFGPSVSGSKVARIFANKFLIFLGNHSYMMYLIHWPILEAFRCAVGEMQLSLNQAVQALFIIAVLSWNLHYIFEKRLKSRKALSSGIAVLCFAFTTLLIMGSAPDSSPHIAYGSLQTTRSPSLHKSNEFFWSQNETLFDGSWNYNRIVSNAIQKNAEWYSGPGGGKNLPNCKNVGESKDHCRITNGPGNLQIAMAGSGFPSAYEAVKSVFNQIDVFYVEDCDVPTGEADPEEDQNSCEKELSSISSKIEDIKPDLLFLFNLYSPIFTKLASSNATISLKVFKHLELLAKSTKQIILNTPFWLPNKDIGSVVFHSLERTVPIGSESYLSDNIDAQHLVRDRLSQIEENCSNCTVFDMTGPFCDSGKCSFYDKKTLLGYYVNSRRLSFKGHELIFPSLKIVVDNVLRKMS
ncbi:hypothetical protein QR680_018184 [Steinernema hermaphroditum]|uniref:Acyltransferase 3 domain-containing protein n=1 Tax=Steinernema hermaphroditum TaxID=289476 RepID=A0AA39HJG6_9BILA|nr:hypothetical protein QR680_018184 [Steinernema hermaphroditum]